MNDGNSPLSPQGSRRREIILVLAEQALEGRIRRRRARRAAVTALGLGVAVVALLVRSSSDAPDAAHPRRDLVVIPPEAPRKSPSATPQMLSDEELVNELAAVGIKAGVVRIGSTIRLVADDGAEIALPDRPRAGAESQG